jgi:alkanesulfonate monooxygenase SsuD/methylene tetrahydromethanopterin reductase-like flavin-dependent oxidoreductase (luciferase family)
MELRRDVIVRAAVLADELGYEVFSVAEGWALDSTVLIAELAAATRRIRLLAGVISVWGRSPATIAMTAATLHRVCGGRFILGLGASTRQLTERWHDVRYVRPAARLRQVTTQVRTLLDGDRATLTAEPAAPGLRLGLSPTPGLPIWLAATGERTIAAAADLADGWYPLYLRPQRLREIVTTMTPGRKLTVAAGPLAVADPDVAAARTAVAACTTAYLSSMGDIYPRVVAAQGWADEVALVQSTRTVPDHAQSLLDEFTAYGTASMIRDKLESWDDAVDLTIVGLPPGLPWPQLEATIRAAAPRT